MIAAPAGPNPSSDLRQPGAILLLSCYELGHVPHGLAMPKAFLERAGFSPTCLDLSVQRPGRTQSVCVLEAALARARLICISVPMHTALRIGVRVAERILAGNRDALLCFYGHYAVLHADFLFSLGVRWLFGGESESELVALAESLNAANPATADRAACATLAKLDFPRPSRRGLPGLSRYAQLDMGNGQLRLAGYTEASRGCLDRCHHCPIPAVYDGRFFVIAQETVLDDIAVQVAAGAEHITFGDPDFLNGPGHGMAILRALHARWPHLGFDITAQISHLSRHRRHLPELAELGCTFVVSAVESLSDVVLARLRKRHRRGDVMEVLDLCCAAGLVLRPTFVSFTPWTTLDDVCELADFVVSEDLAGHVDPIQLTIRLLVPPGSLLLAAEDTRASFGPFDPQALGHVWQHPDPRLDVLQRELAKLVTGALEQHEKPADVLASLREHIHRAAGREAIPLPAMQPRSRRPVPRLTEPWFC